MVAHCRIRLAARGAGLAMLAAVAAAPSWAASEFPPPRAKPAIATEASATVPERTPRAGDDFDRDALAAAAAAAIGAPATATASAAASSAAAIASIPAVRHSGGPQPKPDGISPVAFLSAAEFKVFNSAFAAAETGNHTGARERVGALSEPSARTLIEWMALRGADTLPPDTAASFLSRNPDWPEADGIRARAESWLYSNQTGADATIAYFRQFAPTTGVGMVALAIAYQGAGNKAKAGEWYLRAWREDRLSSSLEGQIRERCGCITKALEKERLDRMAYRGANAEAMRIAKKLGAAYVELAEAHAAVAKLSKGSLKAIGQVPESLKGDTALALTRATALRRADRDGEARTILLNAPHDLETILDPEAWWTERRLTARNALGRDAHLRDAYRIAAAHSLTSGGSFADAEFLSGWIALRHLKDANLAIHHFERLRQAVDQPISIARAEYWLARANDVLGRSSAAQEHRAAAARYGVTFYGQLARNELSGAGAVLNLPQTSEAVWLSGASVESDPMMRAARLLAATGNRTLASRFLTALAQRTSEPGALDRIAKFANLLALPQVSVRIGKIGIARGAPVHDVAYPVSDFPVLADDSDVERALLLALTRQESEFAWQASSHAGARGLMQIMPATGKMLARRAGLDFSLTRLGEDPHYNASLGSAYLAELIQSFGGSYVLAVASYNAGPGRVREWVKKFGDPRSAEIDVVDWIETIPYDETRNYVHRVLENLQVYRARLTGAAVPLALAADLARGREGGQRAYALD